MLTRTQDAQTIRQKGCSEMITSRTKLQRRCKLRNVAIQEHRIHDPARTEDKQKDPYVKEKEKTEIMKLIARRPEMPEDMELSRDDRKNRQK